MISLNNVSFSYPISIRRDIYSIYQLINKFYFFNDQKIKENEVIKDISFNFKRGYSYGILGENGSGKSTLIKLILKKILPNNGKIEFDNNIKFQAFENQLLKTASIEENLKLFLTLKKIDEKIFMKQLYDFMEIKGIFKKYPHELSKGMLVRLNFGMNIFTKPDVIISDENLYGGDFYFINKSKAILNEYLNRGGMLILVSHSIRELELLTQKCLWIKEKKIFKFGNTKQVCDLYLSNQNKKMLEKGVFQSIGEGLEYHNQDKIDVKSNSFIKNKKIYLNIDIKKITKFKGEVILSVNSSKDNFKIGTSLLKKLSKTDINIRLDNVILLPNFNTGVYNFFLILVSNTGEIVYRKKILVHEVKSDHLPETHGFLSLN